MYTLPNASMVVLLAQLLLLLLLCAHHAHASTLVPCPSGEITAVVVLDAGLDYELYDCWVHGGGQIVVNGTVGASLRLERVQLTDPDGDFSVWVDGTSAAVRLIVVNSFVNSSVELNEGNIVVWNALQSGNAVLISNNVFAGRSTITFGSSFKLDATSSITINENDLSQMTKGADAPSPRYSTTTPTFVLVNILHVSGGALAMTRNSLASSGVASGLVPLRQYTVDSTVSLLVVQEFYINPSSTTPTAVASVILEYNYGFYPLTEINVNSITSTPLHFNLSHNAADFIDMAGGVTWISVLGYTINPSPSAAYQDIIANILNNSVAILWKDTSGAPSATFLKLYGLITTICNFENNVFNFTIDGEFTVGGFYAQLATISQEYEEINIIHNTFNAVMRSTFSSNYFGLQIEKVRRLTICHNTMTAVNVSTVDVLYYRQLDSGNVLNTTYLRVTKNFFSIVADPFAVKVARNYRANFISLYANLQLFGGYEATVSENTFAFTSMSLVGGGPSLGRHFERMVFVTQPPSGPLSLLFNKGINAPPPSNSFSASPIFQVSGNIVGSKTSCNYSDVVLLPQLGGVSVANLTVAGCYNWICGQRVADLSANYTNLNWTSCVTPTISRTPTHRTSSASTTMRIAAVSEVSGNKKIVRFEPTKASVPVAVSGTVLGAVTVTTVASGPMIEGVPGIQVWAMYSLMWCQVDGEQPSTAKRLLAPLTFTDFESADLIGSLTLVIGGSLLYYSIAHTVFAVVRKCTPTNEAPTEGQSAENWEKQQWVLERRMQRAKLLLLYPRVPVLLATVLFTGITYDSCRLLYGSAKDTAAVWERVLGGVCLGAAVAFVLYHAWAGWRVHQMIKAAENVADDDERKPLSPHDNHVTGPLSADGSEMAAFSRSHSSAHSRAASHHVSPCDDGAIDDGGSDVLEMPAMVPSGRFISPHRTASPPGDFTSPLSTPPVADAPLELPTDSAVLRSISSPNHDEIEHGAAFPNMSTFVPPLDLPPSKKPAVWDAEANEDTSPSTKVQAGTTNPNDEEAWSVFRPKEKEMFPVVIAAALCASGKWSIAISRARYCVVTAMRPEFSGCLCMTSSSLTRSAAVCMVAAVAATDQTGCDAVYGFLAAISFIHAIFLLALRPYRIPALNPLNALQSALLGLLACTQFMGSETAQSVLSVLFMTACVVTIVVCGVSTFLDFLINRRRAKISQEKSGGLTFRAENHMDI